MRVPIVFSLAAGTALEMAIGPWLGKGMSELAQFRLPRKVFELRVVVVADRFHAAWFSPAVSQAVHHNLKAPRARARKRLMRKH